MKLVRGRDAMKEANDVYAFGWGEWGQNGLGMQNVADMDACLQPKILEVRRTIFHPPKRKKKKKNIRASHFIEAIDGCVEQSCRHSISFFIRTYPHVLLFLLLSIVVCVFFYLYIVHVFLFLVSFLFPPFLFHFYYHFFSSLLTSSLY